MATKPFTVDGNIVVDEATLSNSTSSLVLPAGSIITGGGTVLDATNSDTDDLSEGTANLYFTDARARSAISATGDISYDSSTGVISFTASSAPVTSVNTQTGAVVLDTDNIAEGTNLYYTDARADARIALQAGANLDLSNKSTTDLSEGTNLYYTDTRVRAAVSATTGSAGYDGATGTFSIPANTTQVTEGTNLYYTDARADARIAAASITDLSDADQSVQTTDNVTFANITATGYIAGPATFTIDPAAVGDNTGVVVIAGDLQVDGTTTTINSTTVEVDDLNLTLASGAINAAAANGAGITVDGAGATITYDGVNDEWDFNKDINVTGRIATTGGVSSFDNVVKIEDDVNDTRVQFRRSDTGANAWIGIPAWDTDSLKIYGPTATGDELAATYGSSAWTFRYGGDVRLTTTSSGIDVTGGIIFGDNHAIVSDGNDNLTIESSSSEDVVIKSGSGVIEFRDSGQSGSPLRMKIDTDGKVGIGITNPEAGLDVANGAGYFTSFNNPSGARVGLEIGYDGSKSVLQSYDRANNTFKQILYNASSHYFANGNVGIGTSSPGRLLTLFNNDQPVFQITNNTSGSASTNGMIFYQASGSTNHNIDNQGSGSGGDIQFMAAGSNTLKIQANGNVGIGTASPEVKLEVNGGADGSVVFAGRSDGGNGNNRRFNLIAYADGGGANYGGGLKIQTRDSVNVFQDRITVQSNGNVGIGTSTPDTILEIVSSNPILTLRDTGTGFNNGDATLRLAESGVGDTLGGYFDVRLDASMLKFDFTPEGGSASTYMAINSSDGNVGIGADTPENSLHIKNNTATNGQMLIQGDANNTYIRMNKSGSTWAIGIDAGDSNKFKIGNNSDLSAGTRLTVTTSGNVLINTVDPQDDPSMLRVVNAMSNLGGIYLGKVHNSTNVNTGAVLIHKLGQGQGLQFSGKFIVNSWTGNRHIDCHVTSKYTTDAVTVNSNFTNSGGISQATVRLCTVSYAGSSWIAFVKNGGGTGVSYLNAFISSNIDYNGGVVEVSSGNYSITTTHNTF